MPAVGSIGVGSIGVRAAGIAAAGLGGPFLVGASLPFGLHWYNQPQKPPQPEKNLPKLQLSSFNPPPPT
jgi:hypothetical protein